MTSGYVVTGDSKIYYEMEGVGEALIFLHADTLDIRQWDKQFQYFAQKFKVIRFDLRGFGKSDLPKNGPYSFSEDLNQLMVNLSIEKAHLIGLSLGAAVITDFALTHPEKVISLVLADAGIAGDGFDQNFIDSINSIINLAKEGKNTEAKKAWSDLNIFDYSRNNPEVWQKVQEMVETSSCYRWYGKNQPVDLNPPAATRLSEINVPALILVGEYDIPDFQRKSILLKEKILGSKYFKIPHAGHLSNLDNPEEFNSQLSLFLSSLN